MQTYEFKKQTRTPIKSFKIGALQAAVWENTNSDGGKYQTVSFERRYRDKDGNWQSTNNLRINDIPKAQVILQKTYEYLVFADQGETNE